MYLIGSYITKSGGEINSFIKKILTMLSEKIINFGNKIQTKINNNKTINTDTHKINTCTWYMYWYKYLYIVKTSFKKNFK